MKITLSAQGLLYILLALCTVISNPVFSAEGNTANQSFSKAKKLLLRDVYSKLPKSTIYCNATFNAKKIIVDPNGFESNKYIKRGHKVEWEHVVPAENFGRTFVEWREGDPRCVSSKGKSFKGRNCAGKVNNEYRYMQADMYNLYPAIGAVNALRSNYNFTMLNEPSKQLGGCEIQIISKISKAMPPDYAKGIVARVYLYMSATYPRYHVSNAQNKLFAAWSKRYPVTKVECKRNRLIESIQGNENSIMKALCEK